MSLIRPWTNGDQVALNAGRVPIYMGDRDVNTSLKDGAQLDAFARLRVSNPATVFDNTFQYNLNPTKFSNSLTGTGTITHVPAESEAQLSTGGTGSGAAAILQTKKYIRYQPGKSQMILITANMGAPKANVTQRLGYFDDANGLFFEQTSTGIYVVVRTSTSGSPVNSGALQSGWNLDTLDGNGPSGITLDTSKTQIYIIDFEWLGVGRVRFGFVIDGQIVYCHQVLNANVQTTVYMTTPHLPIRASIENTGVAASATTMDQYCMSVLSEGGVQEDQSNEFAIGRGVAALGVTTRRPVLSIRPSPTFNSIVNRGHVIFDELEVLAATNNCLWELVQNGTLTGAAWGSVDATYSIADYDTTATAIAGGIVRNRGWAIAGLGAAAGKSVGESIIELFNDFTGTTPDILSVVCTSFTGTTSVNALMRWSEQR